MTPSRALSHFVRRNLAAVAVAALLLVTLGQVPPLAQGDAAALIARIEAPQTPESAGLRRAHPPAGDAAPARPGGEHRRGQGLPGALGQGLRRRRRRDREGGGGDDPLPGGVDQQAGDGHGGDAAGAGPQARPRRRRERGAPVVEGAADRGDREHAGDAAGALQPHLGRRRRLRLPRLRPVGAAAVGGADPERPAAVERRAGAVRAAAVPGLQVLRRRHHHHAAGAHRAHRAGRSPSSWPTPCSRRCRWPTARSSSRPRPSSRRGSPAPTTARARRWGRPGTSTPNRPRPGCGPRPPTWRGSSSRCRPRCAVRPARCSRRRRRGR